MTADHGEELMEHGWIGHTRTLFDELLHVPLIVWLPGVLEPAEIEAPVSLVDIAPSVLSSLGAAVSAEEAEGLDGSSFWPLLPSPGSRGRGWDGGRDTPVGRGLLCGGPRQAGFP